MRYEENELSLKKVREIINLKIRKRKNNII